MYRVGGILIIGKLKKDYHLPKYHPTLKTIIKDHEKFTRI